MQELFIKSLQMIKVLDIKKQSEYERIITYFLVTGSLSLLPESINPVEFKTLPLLNTISTLQLKLYDDLYFLCS